MKDATLFSFQPAEFEGVVGQLAISARRFGMGPASRNYIAYLRKMFA